MENTYLIGIFRNQSQLECKEGLIKLTTIDVNSSKSPLEIGSTTKPDCF